MPAVLLPLLAALVFAGGAVHAYGATPVSSYGEAYEHVPNHLVSAGLAALVAAAVLALGRGGRTRRARRRSAWLSGAWAVVSLAFVLDAVGGGIGDRTGNYAVHDLAMMLLLGAALLMLAATAVVIVTRGGWAPWPLRLGILVNVPAIPSLSQAGSDIGLSVGLTSAAIWLTLAVHAWATRPSTGSAPGSAAQEVAVAA